MSAALRWLFRDPWLVSGAALSTVVGLWLVPDHWFEVCMVGYVCFELGRSQERHRAR